MLKIGLTGGIGCGKTTVCRLFAELGVPVVDADLIARSLVEPGQPALQAIVQAFGTEILQADGSLDRAKLRQAIFSDPEQRRRLDGIMHPLVYARIAADVAALQAAYCLIAVPLLLESKNPYAVDRILVVDCPQSAQIERVVTRDKLSAEQAQAIVASQMPRPQRLARADDVIDNSAGPEQLAEQVKSLHNSYIFLATARTPSA
ncbi:dephospho-CoA kinase [Methylomonas koyamae]|uniref:Dephospho-CoA kinase n=1 Tax=Methylomonas koyamae TaxID=702114 RepID=A0AA91DC86_9GAMM|nr:dephospho-CoA kinase [Methylomonas koyamae]OAI24372.1 dephospho-CoA kinase [Methylomonas koyamae]WNB76141.1 dephospho-CoA kinase [Methylomonas koyamae]